MKIHPNGEVVKTVSFNNTGKWTIRIIIENEANVIDCGNIAGNDNFNCYIETGLEKEGGEKLGWDHMAAYSPHLLDFSPLTLNLPRWS